MIGIKCSTTKMEDLTVYNSLKSIRAYAFPLLLIFSIVLGGLVGHVWGEQARLLKPLGDIFIHLIFTTIVPLIFFSVASAISKISTLKKLKRIFSSMFIIFLFTGMVASGLTLLVIQYFPIGQGISVPFAMSEKIPVTTLSEQLVSIFTVPDFSSLLSHQHLLALIVFSMLVGFAVSTLHDDEKQFAKLLQTGEQVFMRVFSIIMYYAPIGFFAYFATLVSELGPKIMAHYLQVAIFYYVFAILYFFLIYTSYAYLAGKRTGVALFWKHVFLPAVTSIATCSSAASIPANLYASERMLVEPEIYETVIPLGAMIHKDGSVIGGVIKIAFLFGMFHLNFSGPSVFITAFGVSLLVGTVMGAIPSGGMLGELLILSVYGFPPSALIAIAAISIIIDPLATLLNVTGTSVCSMMIARGVNGPNWFKQKKLSPSAP